MPEQIIQIKSLPGIKRDGTRLEGDNYVDGQWVRFQRGLPRKIGGYRSISKHLKNLVRSLHEYTQDGLTYIHAGSSAAVERFFIDEDNNTSSITYREPASLAASGDTVWQFDTETTAAAPGLQLVAHAAANGSDISNSLGGQLFYGDLFGTTALTEATAFPADANISGGVVSLRPYTVVYGADGFVGWSPDCADFTVSGAGYAFVTGQKIVRGLPMRGGPGASPSGILWSLDSVLRMTFVGGTAGFQFDTLSSQSSILSSQCPIEYDGVFYWIGVDRFLMFNGVVREIENNLNINFFFDNLNFAQRQKVFAFKVPRYGEIWWCFPKGDSIVPNHAIILNVREGSWYDTELPAGGRSAGASPAVFRRPLLAGSLATEQAGSIRVTAGGDTRITESGDVRVTEDTGQNRYKFWVHESGVDEVDGTIVVPIRSFFETADISLPVAAGIAKGTQVLMIEPDFVQRGPMTVTVTGRANARAREVEGEPMTFEDTAATPQEQVVYLKTQRRELRFRFESNVVGGDYQMGLILAHVQPGDGTVIGG